MAFPLSFDKMTSSEIRRLAMAVAEPYTNIKAMVVNYHQSMRTISQELQKNPGGPQLDIANEPIGFYVTNVDLQRLSATIGQLPDFRKYLCLFGIESATGHLTISVVGAKEDGNVLDIYKDNPTTEGEETWPKAIFNLSQNDVALARFLEIK